MAIEAAADGRVASFRGRRTVCLEALPDLAAIGLRYSDFEQTSDEEVIEPFERARPGS